MSTDASKFKTYSPSRAPVLEGGQMQFVQVELMKIKDAMDSLKRVLELLEARIAALE